MPNYVYSCKLCSKEHEAFHTIAERFHEFCCGEPMNIVPTCKGMQVWRKFVSEQLDVHDVEITSKRQYKEELKKRDFECRGLL